MKKIHSQHCLTNQIDVAVWGEGICNCDTYHTFDELYVHRHTLFIALCKKVVQYHEAMMHMQDGNNVVWRSKRHHPSNAAMYDGWFILGIGTNPMSQITYHLPLHYWSQTDFANTFESAPLWDGHTSEDVIKRLPLL